MLHAPPQLVCLGRVEYYDYDDRPAGVCNFAASSASPDVWLGSRPRGPRAPPEGNSASRSTSHFARKAVVAAAVGSRELLLRWSCQWPVFARSRSGRPVWTSLQPPEAEAAPPPLPCTEGGVGKTCLSSPCLSPSPPSQGSKGGRLSRVCRLGGSCKAGRPAGAGLPCKPADPSRLLHLAPSLKWPPTQGEGALVGHKLCPT